MATSVHPWLRAFACDDLERRAQLGGLESTTRAGKKVQIVKFLTFRPVGDSSASNDIWAQVSDPSHFIACRFLAEAVTRFRRTVPPFVDLTSLKGSIILIKAARIVAWPWRIPSQIKNSPWAHVRPGGTSPGAIVLEVSDWKVLGCVDEGPFWENALEVSSTSRRPTVKIEVQSRRPHAGVCDLDMQADADEAQGRALRRWIAEAASQRDSEQR